MSPIVRKWWKHGTVYQIWPASYKDSTGNGIGDIPGIISTLDYLKELGVDIIWCSPMYSSPQKDMGYDISNFEDIAPQYGTLADAERLIHECHARGMRIIFDLVINHTSDQHAWFRESRSSRDNPKRDWYIWRPPRISAAGERQPPNNWRSYFGGSAWAWDEGTQEYWLHLFTPEQPDLNFENDAARAAIYASAITFWLRKGIDGFRIDTVNLYSKPTAFVDAPVLDTASAFQSGHAAWTNGPRMHEFLTEIHTLLAARDCMTVGELAHTTDTAHVLRYVSAAARQLDMVFQFDVVDLGKGGANSWALQPFALTDFKAAVAATQALPANPANDGWGTAFLENHDQPRSLSRFASDEPAFRDAGAKLLACLLACLSGTLFLYQGQEIGMSNAPAPWPPEEYKDISTQNYLAEVRAQAEAAASSSSSPQDGAALLAEAMRNVNFLARDHARTPVQWSAEEPDAGFSPRPAARPWMRVHENFRAGVNVQAQLAQETRGMGESVLHFWRRALGLRKDPHLRDLMVYGTFEVLGHGDGDAAVGGAGEQEVFAFVKGDVEGDGRAPRRRLLVLLNFTGREAKCVLGTALGTVGALVLGTNTAAESAAEEGKVVDLAPWEGRAYELLL